MRLPLLFAGMLELCLAACLDQPLPIPGPGQHEPAARLSDMGVFVGPLSDLAPAADITPYGVNAPLYSDLASKQRFVWLPPGETFHATDDRWDIPDGAYLIKNFLFPVDARDPSRGRRIIETRFLVARAGHLDASTYVWNDDQTDAFVSGGNEDIAVDWTDAAGIERHQQFHVPGTSQCQDCHADRALGWRTRQQPDPASLVAAGLLDATPPAGVTLVDPGAGSDLDARARSYLDANCSHCHGDGGEAAGTGVLFDYEHTSPELLPRCRATPSVGGNDRVIVPGSPERSALLSRLTSPDPFLRMPRGPSRLADADGVALVTDWIAAMPAQECP